ncbi:Svf1 family protein Svf1 [Schizosaccharomyces japonicus yFS275]|uniref:Svf1 family protein Svf1 n=1 Tax=Schizosaccharomyces japonicus (strain yFS275 / FY16936) TaxID=402676 RepID=B6K4X6_SCHJY|nr:Svf1 family protein Svf1 [Schizosaccharomyces japonicus yFS275]EEB08533.2 Svf1 family protein Svf1 [Schizosaccharomyces japonicus yFS275]
MKAWLQSNIAYYTGTAEPIYGREAIETVEEVVGDSNPFHELEPIDYQWDTPASSHVETETFYIKPVTGNYMCFVQIIHSNLGSWTTTAQVVCRVFDLSNPENDLWTSTNLSEFTFEDNKQSFKADKVSFQLQPDRRSYKVQCSVCMDSIIDFTFERLAPPFKIGEHATTSYGTDHTKPWATMKHSFWPRASVTGSIVAHGKVIDVTGSGMFVHALQNGKPQHLGCAWEFALLLHSKYTAVMMQFKTPPSYGSAVVNVGGIATDEGVVAATVKNSVVHKATKLDPDTEWQEPTRIEYVWSGKDAETFTKDVKLEVDAELGRRLERIDVLSEIPSWLRGFVHGISGTKPFIYQYNSPVTFSLTIGDEVIHEDAVLFNETTFIS